jgi:hypothetical protein
MTAMRTDRNASVPLAVLPFVAIGDLAHGFYDAPAGLLTDKRYAGNTGTSYIYTPDHKFASRIWACGITTIHTYAPFQCVSVFIRPFIIRLFVIRSSSSLSLLICKESNHYVIYDWK